MTQWTGSQNRDECGGFSGFFEGISWITRKFRAAKSEFEEGSVGHASESPEHLFSSPYHAGWKLIKAHIIPTTFLHVRFDKKENQLKIKIGDFRTAMRQCY